MALRPPTGIVTSSIGPYEIDLDMRDEIQRQVFFGLYDSALTRLLPSILRSGSVFYDLGANIGYFTLIASGIVGPNGHVYAFEPIPENALRVKQSLERNGISNVTVIEAAVLNSTGSTTMFVSDMSSNSGWGSIVSSPTRQRKITVATTSLDSLVYDHGAKNPDVVKIDIEGAEPFALEGMSRLLSQDSGPDVIIELNSYLLTRSGFSPSDLVQLLRNKDYFLFELQEQRINALCDSRSSWPLMNVYATKRRDPNWISQVSKEHNL